MTRCWPCRLTSPVSLRREACAVSTLALVALLERGGFREIEQPFSALHTLMLVAKK